MTLPPNELRELAEEILTRSGLKKEDAEIVTDILLEAELRGRKTHGLVRIPGITRAVREKRYEPIRITREVPFYALVDGRENLGYIVAYRCARIAIEKAGAKGLSLVGVFNTNHCGMAGYYVSMIAHEGLIGIMVCDTFPRIVPWGASEPVLGTNPLAIGIPTGDGPIIADMSTAAITNGDLIVAAKAGRRIPQELALDRGGNFTDDPEEALEGGVLPFGGHKGYALALIIQILSGALVNAATIPNPGENYGILFMSIDPSIFGTLKDFERDVAYLLERIKGTRKMTGVDEIRVPGERGWRERATRLREGIEVNDDLLKELRRLVQ